jgi:hypothetical protein
MDNRIKAAASTFSIFAGLIALSATVYAVKNRKGISTSVKEDVNGLTDRSALLLHNKIGMPIYNYIKRKDNSPF